MTNASDSSINRGGFIDRRQPVAPINPRGEEYAWSVRAIVGTSAFDDDGLGIRKYGEKYALCDTIHLERPPAAVVTKAGLVVCRGRVIPAMERALEGDGSEMRSDSSKFLYHIQVCVVYNVFVRANIRIKSTRFCAFAYLWGRVLLRF